MITEIKNFRAKYPQYDGLDDMDLAQRLAKKYPDAYGALPEKVSSETEVSHETEVSQRPQDKVDEMLASEDKSDRPGLDTLKGFGEAALTVGSSMVAEPVAGMAGMAKTITGLVKDPTRGDIEAGQTIEDVRKSLTYQPRSEEGQDVLKGMATLLQPFSEGMEYAEKGIGDYVMKKTDSPALAALATTIPQGITEIIGLKGAGKTVKTAKNINKARKSGDIISNISKAVPDIDQLKTTSRGLFKEIDKTGARIKSMPFKRLVRNIENKLRKSGADPDTTKGSIAVLNRLKKSADLEADLPLTEIDTIRKMANDVARTKTANPADASKGVMIVDTIDDFLDKSGFTVIKTPDGVSPVNLSKKYKVAREMWGRAKRAEMIERAFVKANNAAGGFENGIVTQFRQILNNDAKVKYFKKHEIDAMERVVRGSKKENMAKFLGKFDITGKNPSLMSILGITGGVAKAGPLGLMVPFTGFVSKKLAEKMVRKNADFASDIIKAGQDAEKITKAYLKNVKKKDRSPQELSQLLMRKNIKYKKTMPDYPLLEQAKQIAFDTMGNTTRAAGTLIPAASTEGGMTDE